MWDKVKEQMITAAQQAGISGEEAMKAFKLDPSDIMPDGTIKLTSERMQQIRDIYTRTRNVLGGITDECIS